MVKVVPPARIQASWPPPNYVNPITRGPALPVVCSLLLTGVVLVLAGRFWTRMRIQRWVGADDWLILAAFIPCLTLNLCILISPDYGWNIHIWDLPPAWDVPNELLSWLIQLTYTMTMSLAKLSLLVSYLRVLPISSTLPRVLLWVTFALVALWGVALSFATIFSCYPVSLYWTSTTGQGCTDENIRLIVTSVVNILTDALVVAIPMAVFSRLQLPFRQKLVLCGLLSLGLVATVASIVRTAVLSSALETYDVTWAGYVVWILTAVECDLALACASVPALRPLLARWMGHGSGPSRGNSSYARSASRFSKVRMGSVPDKMVEDSDLRRIHETVEFEVRISEDGRVSEEEDHMSDRKVKCKSEVWVGVNVA